MRELSLFSGAGGGLLGTKLLGFRHVGYVEFNEHCQKILAQRIKDGFLDEAPIFTDVRAFTDIAEVYRGIADVVTAGFPCQPFSVAGKQKGADDSRNMWPATIDIIRKVKPRVAFLENVPGLLSVCDESAGHFRYIQQIFRDLAEAGYNARWCVLGADDCGAPHHRKRLWIYAYSKHDGSPAAKEFRGDGEAVFNKQEREVCSSEFARVGSSEDVANSNNKRLEGRQKTRDIEEGWQNRVKQLERFSQWPVWGECPVEPRICGMANGVADRVERLKALGNGQVPIVATTAFRLLKNN